MEKQNFNFIQKNLLKITLLAAVIMIAVPLANVSAAKVTDHNIYHRTVISNLNGLSGHMRIGLQSLSKNWKQILYLNKLTFKNHNIKTAK